MFKMQKLKTMLQAQIGKFKATWFVFYRKVKRFARIFEPIFRIVEILLILAATWLSVASIKSSNQSTKEISQHLSKIDSIFISINTNFADIPINLQNFNNTVAKLDSTAKRQEQEMLRVNNLMGKQVNLISERQKVIEDELKNVPDLYLKVRDVIKDTLKNRVKLTFVMGNKGKAIGEKVQIRFFIPDSLEPEGEPKDMCVLFTSGNTDKGIKYSYYQAGGEYVYPPQNNYTYESYCSLILSFRIPKKFSRIVVLEYNIDHLKGSVSKTVSFNNPYYPN